MRTWRMVSAVLSILLANILIIAGAILNSVSSAAMNFGISMGDDGGVEAGIGIFLLSAAILYLVEFVGDPKNKRKRDIAVIVLYALSALLSMGNLKDNSYLFIWSLANIGVLVFFEFLRGNPAPNMRRYVRNPNFNSNMHPNFGNQNFNPNMQQNFGNQNFNPNMQQNFGNQNFNPNMQQNFNNQNFQSNVQKPNDVQNNQ